MTSCYCNLLSLASYTEIAIASKFDLILVVLTVFSYFCSHVDAQFQDRRSLMFPSKTIRVVSAQVSW